MNRTRSEMVAKAVLPVTSGSYQIALTSLAGTFLMAIAYVVYAGYVHALTLSAPYSGQRFGAFLIWAVFALMISTTLWPLLARRMGRTERLFPLFLSQTAFVLSTTLGHGLFLDALSVFLLAFCFTGLGYCLEGHTPASVPEAALKSCLPIVALDMLLRTSPIILPLAGEKGILGFYLPLVSLAVFSSSFFIRKHNLKEST